MKKLTIQVGDFKNHLFYYHKLKLIIKMSLQKYLKIKSFFIALAIVAIFIGCQREYLKISEPDKETTITANDPIVDLLLKVALKDGSFDNIIDRCNEISIKFPYSVKIKNEILEITSKKDAESVKAEYFQVRNSINIVYPVTIVFSDYTEIIISNTGELRKIQNQYNTTIEDDDIECIDFIYPVEIALYDTVYQELVMMDVGGDRDLYNVFKEMNNTIAEIEYPILMESSDGNTATIENNMELENVINEGANTGCDEEDDIVSSSGSTPYHE